LIRLYTPDLSLEDAQLNSDLRTPDSAHRPDGTAGEVFWAALKLGLGSFGGPIAHLGYFERTYVRNLRWLSGDQYSGLISLCQLLPGPSSSQVGFLVGLHRAGWLGALAAWIGFTLPSALAMYAFALWTPAQPGPRMQAILHGLMLTAVVVVAQAVWTMARTLCPDWRRRLIAIVACMVLLFQHDSVIQFATLVGGACAGVLLCRSLRGGAPSLPVQPNRHAAWLALAMFVTLLVGLPALAVLDPHGPAALANIFYRSGAFVFGGGHVVLPLLQQSLVPSGWVSDSRFLAGYGFAQAMPGPLFTFAAYLGAVTAPPHQSLLWSLLALATLFLPGLLLAISGLSLFGKLAGSGPANGALAGINAAVIGLLAAALYNPVWTGAVHSVIDTLVVMAALFLLQWYKLPPILIAGLCVATSLGLPGLHFAM
jgi:chromate transporter